MCKRKIILTLWNIFGPNGYDSSKFWVGGWGGGGISKMTDPGRVNPLRTIRIGWAENYKNKPKCSFLCVKSESKVHFFKSFLDLEILHGSYLTQSS